MSEWILVSERLPDRDGNYWVTYEGNNAVTNCWYHEVWWSDDKVLAWQPIEKPTPYIPPIEWSPELQEKLCEWYREWSTEWVKNKKEYQFTSSFLKWLEEVNRKEKD